METVEMYVNWEQKALVRYTSRSP